MRKSKIKKWHFSALRETQKEDINQKGKEEDMCIYVEKEEERALRFYTCWDPISTYKLFNFFA